MQAVLIEEQRKNYTRPQTMKATMTKPLLVLSIFLLGANVITAFAVDLYSGRDVKSRDSDSLSIGLTAVQTLDYHQADLYVTTRWYDFDDPAASYESSVALLTGVRFRF